MVYLLSFFATQKKKIHLLGFRAYNRTEEIIIINLLEVVMIIIIILI